MKLFKAFDGFRKNYKEVYIKLGMSLIVKIFEELGLIKREEEFDIRKLRVEYLRRYDIGMGVVEMKIYDKATNQLVVRPIYLQTMPRNR